uniref:Uncharacterized protein n=1 Tax=Arion vulgaris TaxID=1028688 RepID=A0A0B7A901_9EUPU
MFCDKNKIEIIMFSNNDATLKHSQKLEGIYAKYKIEQNRKIGYKTDDKYTYYTHRTDKYT